MSDQIIDLCESLQPGPRGEVGPTGERGLPGVNAVENDEAVAGYVRASDSSTSGALAGSWPRWATRRFVVFGDSWTTTLAGNVCIPSEAVGLLGGSVVGNYGVGGAQLADTSMSTNSLEQQANRAKTDTTVDKALISDVLVIMGVNNLNGTKTDYLPDYTTLTSLFASLRLYPNARYWYTANSKNMIIRSDPAAWNHYNLFQRAAADAGFAVSRWSPMWNWGREDLWLSDDPGERHMNEAGQRLWSRRLAGFLSGTDWKPVFTIPAAAAFTPSHDLLDIQPAAKFTGCVTVDGSTLDVRLQFDARNAEYRGTEPVMIGNLVPRYMGVLSSPEHVSYVYANNQSVIDHSQMRYLLREWELNAYGEVKVDPSVFRDNQGFFTLSARIELCGGYV